MMPSTPEQAIKPDEVEAEIRSFMSSAASDRMRLFFGIKKWEVTFEPRPTQATSTQCNVYVLLAFGAIAECQFLFDAFEPLFLSDKSIWSKEMRVRLHSCLNDLLNRD